MLKQMSNFFIPRVSKVLMTTDSVSGVWTYSLELCKALERYDISIDLVILGGFLNDQQRAEIRTLHNVRPLESNYKLEWMESACLGPNTLKKRRTIVGIL